MDENKELIQQSKDLIQRLTDALQETRQELARAKSALQTWEQVTDSDNWQDMSQVAKILREQDKKYKVYGRNTIFAILREAKILRHNNEPYQYYVDNDSFKQVIVDKSMGIYGTRMINKTVVSPKGIDLIRSILDGLND